MFKGESHVVFNSAAQIVQDTYLHGIFGSITMKLNYFINYGTGMSLIVMLEYHSTLSTDQV